jgi:protein-S-isoprenylcysteine O-methyltransferase Ste14
MATDPRSLASYTLTTCWVIFFVFWVVSACFTKRSASRQGLRESMAYRIIGIGGCLVLIFARRFPESLGIRFVQQTDFLAWVSALLGVAGLGICLWARITLGRNWSSVVMVKERHELVQGGPYRYVRHPIYTGLLVLFTGDVLLYGYWGGIVGEALLLLSFWIKLRHEETAMVNEFPGDYPIYMQRVKRLIPFVL